MNNDSQDRIGRIKISLLSLIPTSEQNSWGILPSILIHQVRASMEDVTWIELQLAYDALCVECMVYPAQDFSSSILKRAYRSRY